ncbi:response regulator [Deinococcus peraridilitoris]|uniref:Response regulator with CheY-like receiver, AAA-type ATPase, and DNA-binding domains n=1 Tax=Deinococcus peraridilitoris (strain DSM 19664 / LMG 22246 / CIP 109416 / KR-200) TaxID=937777 RepID=K9ZXC3_DEIPD|nr:response regulator [Deinococcus peraridilitoris]AFZ65849.1 response regulator with CheY-like receiver, AAA-type ATPase, and DNA-binding domains [Deinococcus peraridilitoris DSM 19664]
MAKIVIVDDSNADLKLMESILTSGSHTVTALNDPTLAEERIASEKPDLVMLDVVMPAKNGYEVLRGLKRNPVTKDLPVVLVSSKAADTDVRWGLRQGASEYITKPYTAEQVLAAVRKVVG